MSVHIPHGVKIIQLESHQDKRGTFIELFRHGWIEERNLIQWSIFTSRSNTIRGVHVHFKHYDYLTITQGHMQLGLIDLRYGSPTEKLSVVLNLHQDSLQTVLIPPGIAHGFRFIEDSVCLLGVSHYWDTEDEKGCSYKDPGLGLGWEDADCIISDKDRSLPTLDELLKLYSFPYYCYERAPHFCNYGYI